MKFNFKNKTVLITGGEGGLGKSICSKFAELGAKVIITTTNKKLISYDSLESIYSTSAGSLLGLNVVLKYDLYIQVKYHL